MFALKSGSVAALVCAYVVLIWSSCFCVSVAEVKMDPKDGGERKRVTPQEVSVISSSSLLHTLARDLVVLTSTWLALPDIAKFSCCDKRLYSSLTCGDDPRDLESYFKRLMQAVGPDLCLRLLHDHKLRAYAVWVPMIQHCRAVLETHSAALQAKLVRRTSTISLVRRTSTISLSIQLAPTVIFHLKLGTYLRDPSLLGELEVYPYDEKNALHRSVLDWLKPLGGDGLESECDEHFESHRRLWRNLIRMILDNGTGTRTYPTPFPDGDSKQEQNKETVDSNVKHSGDEQKGPLAHNSSLLEKLSNTEMYNVLYLLTRAMKVNYAYSSDAFQRHGLGNGCVEYTMLDRSSDSFQRRGTCNGCVVYAMFDLSPFDPVSDRCIWREVTTMAGLPTRLKTAGEKGTEICTHDVIAAYDLSRASEETRNAKRKAFLDHLSSWIISVPPAIVTQPTVSSSFSVLPWRR